MSGRVEPLVGLFDLSAADIIGTVGLNEARSTNGGLSEGSETNSGALLIGESEVEHLKSRNWAVVGGNLVFWLSRLKPD